MSLREIVGFLNGFTEEYAIPHFYIGAIASNYHGHPRPTKDADLVIFIDPQAANDVVDSIEDAGILVQDRRKEVIEKLEEGSPAKFAWDKEYSFDLRVASYFIDEEALERSFLAKTREGFSVILPPPEEIIVYKLARFTKKDKADIEGMLAKQGFLEWDHIDSLAESLAEEMGNYKILENLDLMKIMATYPPLPAMAR